LNSRHHFLIIALDSENDNWRLKCRYALEQKIDAKMVRWISPEASLDYFHRHLFQPFAKLSSHPVTNEQN
jgi:hypothetical protein